MLGLRGEASTSSSLVISGGPMPSADLVKDPGDKGADYLKDCKTSLFWRKTQRSGRGAMQSFIITFHVGWQMGERLVFVLELDHTFN